MHITALCYTGGKTHEWFREVVVRTSHPHATLKEADVVTNWLDKVFPDHAPHTCIGMTRGRAVSKRTFINVDLTPPPGACKFDVGSAGAGQLKTCVGVPRDHEVVPLSRW